mgnify:CR=1 FL=1
MNITSLPLKNRNESLITFEPKIGPRQKEILALLERYPSGLTAWEISSRTAKMVHTTRPRICELAAHGRIEPCGKRWYDGTQRNETVWRIVAQTDLFHR